MPDIKCELCDTHINPDGYIRSGNKRESYYECENCGHYSIIDESFRFIVSPIEKATLGYWIKKNQSLDKHPILTQELTEKIIKENALPDINEQIINLIEYLGKNSSYGKSIEIWANKIIALIGAIDKESLLYVFDELNRNNYIKVLNPKIDKESLMNRNVLLVKCQVTVEGWNKYKKIISKNSPLKEFNFKKHKFSPDEILWLKELWNYNFENVESRSIKVRLVDKISTNFNPSEISWIFARENRITLLGLWYIDPDNTFFKTTHLVIEQLQYLIKQEPKLKQIDSDVVYPLLNISKKEVQIVFTFLIDLGFCNGGTYVKDLLILDQITFNPDQNSFDKILYFNSIEETLENNYNQFFNSNFINNSNLTSTPKVSKAKSKSYINQEVWQQIAEEFNINQISFGRKINFVKDQSARKIIFRDVEDAYVLYKKGFPKPAIILAGGVIEELLRIFLIGKGHSFKHNKFFEYIEICATNNYLRRGARLLTDSTRDYRNLVHLENEANTKTKPTQSMAAGSVSAIFTIVNDF